MTRRIGQTIIAALLAVMAYTVIAFSSTPVAHAHTVTKTACVRYGAHHGPHQYDAYQRCMRWATWHNWREHCGGTVRTIHCVFGPYGSQAVAVAACESTLRTWAQNGQYRGLFQMGVQERARYGDGSDALSQTRAAYRYFVASGRDWSPWQCRP